MAARVVTHGNLAECKPVLLILALCIVPRHGGWDERLKHFAKVVDKEFAVNLLHVCLAHHVVVEFAGVVRNLFGLLLILLSPIKLLPQVSQMPCNRNIVNPWFQIIKEPIFTSSLMMKKEPWET